MKSSYSQNHTLLSITFATMPKYINSIPTAIKNHNYNIIKSLYLSKYNNKYLQLITTKVILKG